MTDLTNTSPVPVTTAAGGVIGSGETGTFDLDDPNDRAHADAGSLNEPFIPDEPTLEDMTVEALKTLAADRKVDLGDATKKADIIAALETKES